MQYKPAEILTPTESLTERKRRATLDHWLGRPSAAQKRLLDALLAAMVSDFENYGPVVIERVRDKDPVNYLRLMVAMVRKPLSDLETERMFSHDDIVDALARLDRIAARYPVEAHQLPGGADGHLPSPGLPGVSKAE